MLVSVHTQDPLIGRPIDRYRVEAAIGMGSTGRVYRALHSSLDELVALKLIWGDVGSDHQRIRRLQRLVEASRHINHPNVVRVMEQATTRNGLSYLVMELVPGASLRHHLNYHGPVSPLRATQVASQVADGLTASHAAGFVHRDIKPANIIQISSQPLHVKILDFGLVGMALEETDARITASGSFVGTPLYMAPEQAKSASDVGPAADIYSLGIMLFELITGYPPFAGQTPLDVLIAHSTHPVPHLQHLGRLGDLISWALEKKPHNRPSSAYVFSEHLRRITRQLEAHSPS
ncbi:MAG: serine/threonine protein kinase [Myxococcales bacterium]|nr:serine/threonine protein kinase [Myxococcales bacterium]